MDLYVFGSRAAEIAARVRDTGALPEHVASDAFARTIDVALAARRSDQEQSEQK